MYMSRKILICDFVRTFGRRSYIKRCYSSSHGVQSVNKKPLSELLDDYKNTKRKNYEDPIDFPVVDKHAVFANNEISFRYITTYGFDYDYTLANYSRQLHVLIYNLASENLITKYGYPDKIRSYAYDPGFPIRGLHYDTEKGYMMKLDSFSHVQLGSVYKGRSQVDTWDVVKEYGGTLINVDHISKGQKKAGDTIHQQMDLFSLPFLSLLANVTDYFITNGIYFDPGYIYYDVEKATQEIHTSGQMHRLIMEDLDRYLPKKPELVHYLNNLVVSKKKLFMITNSSFNFVDKGMRHLVGQDWRDLFDVVVTNARKPRFFTDISRASRPFRSVNTTTGHYLWDQVQSFEKHGVYGEGNILQFTRFTGYEGPNVIYFGDHVYSDLMDPVLRHGWRTGAIIPELETDISNDGMDVLNAWRNERKFLRKELKSTFNPYFGSMFRTHNNPTSFSRRMTRYADIYTSSLSNLLQYPLDFHFFPRRNALPHEQTYDR